MMNAVQLSLNETRPFGFGGFGTVTDPLWKGTGVVHDPEVSSDVGHRYNMDPASTVRLLWINAQRNPTVKRRVNAAQAQIPDPQVLLKPEPMQCHAMLVATRDATVSSING